VFHCVAFVFKRFSSCVVFKIVFRCIQVVNDILPTKARKEVDRLIAEAQDAQFQLEFEPTTTVEYIKSLTFLDQIQERVSIFIKASN
jgi:hypothetical protein